jgi:hypothetical protein
MGCFERIARYRERTTAQFEIETHHFGPMNVRASQWRRLLSEIELSGSSREL